MIRRYLSTAMVLVLMALSAAQAAQDPNITLKLNLKPGEMFKNVNTTEMNISQTVSGRSIVSLRR